MLEVELGMLVYVMGEEMIDGILGGDIGSLGLCIWVYINEFLFYLYY